MTIITSVRYEYTSRLGFTSKAQQKYGTWIKFNNGEVDDNNYDCDFSTNFIKEIEYVYNIDCSCKVDSSNYYYNYIYNIERY